MGNCSQNKPKSDLAWQEESLKFAREICEKTRTCLKEFPLKLSPEKIALLEKRLSEGDCQDRFRKTPVFRLDKGNTELIQTSFRECHKALMQETCSGLQLGAQSKISACHEIEKIQSGKE